MIHDNYPLEHWMICDTCGCLVTGKKPGDRCNTIPNKVGRRFGAFLCTGMFRQAVISDIDGKKDQPQEVM